MIAQQPLDTLPRLSESDLHGSWLNKMTKGGKDYAPDGNDMDRVGLPIDERVGMTFDGAADYLRKVEANWQSGDSVGTISAWVKLAAAGTSNVIFSSADEGATNHRFNLMLADSERLLFQHQEVADIFILGDTVFDLNRWYHVAVTGDGSIWILYVDGVVEGLTVSGSNTGEWIDVVTLRDNITIGAERRTTVTGEFDGSIKDVRYYSRVLTADEIKLQYKAGVPDDSLALHLHKDQFDKSRFAAEFDNVNGVVLGHEMEFNGTTNYLKRSVSDWRIEDSQGTISAWVKRKSFTTSDVIFSSMDEGSVNYMLQFYIDGTDVLTVRQRDGIGDTLDTTLGTSLINREQWHHVVLVGDGTKYLFYIDGVNDPVSAGLDRGLWFADTSNRDNVLIGAFEHTGVSNWFDGPIKDLSVFSEVKSADWVKELYERTRIYY